MPRYSLSAFLDRWLPRSSIARSVCLLVSGTAAAQSLAILASPLLTRIYTPGEFGILQIFISLMSMTVVAASGRYEVAILLPDDEQAAIDVLVLALACVAVVTLGCIGLVFGLQYYWILPSSMRALRPSLWLLPVSILGGGIYQVLNFWAVRRGDYKQIAKSKLMQATLQVTTQIGAGLLAHGPIGLLVGDSIGRISGSSRFIRDLWRDHRGQLCNVRIRRMATYAMRYRRYPLISVWGALINSSGLALPSLFLAQYYGAENTGWFALVNRVMGVPTALIGMSLLQVFTAETARLSRSDPSKLMHLFLRTSKGMLYFGLAPCALFVFAAPWLFQKIFGHPWREAGEYARYLALMFYVSFIDSPVTMTLLVLERQRTQLVWDTSRLALTVAAIAIPFRLGCGVRIAVISYGFAMAAMYCIHWTQSYYTIGHCMKQFASITPAKAAA